MTRAGAALAALALAAGGLAAAFAWQPGLGSLFDDSVSYLVIAQAIAPFGAAPPAVAAAAPLEKYPPLVALLVALAGGAFDWRIAHAVIAASFAASVLALGAYARALTGSGVLAFGAALAYALLPGSWLNLKGILSEFPYMALSFAALALHLSRGGAPLPRRVAVALGVLLAAAFLARTIAVALVAAIALAELARWTQGRERDRLASLAWIGGLPVAAALAWYLLRPSAGEDAYAEYAARVAGDASRGGLAYLADRLAGNAAALRDAWLNALMIFWGEPWKPAFILSAAIGIAGLAATAMRALRLAGDALYAAFFLAILLAWPFPGQMFRLALPVIPLVLVAFLWAGQRVLERRGALARWSPAAALLPLAVCAPATLFYIAPRAGTEGAAAIAEYYRIPDRRAAEANARAQLGVLEDLRRVGATTPPEARVMWYWPNYVALLAQRQGVRLERPRDAAGLARQVLATRADYLYIAELHPRDSAARDGHPIDPLAHALRMGDVAWHRSTPGGAIHGALVRFDRERVRAAATP